MKARPLTPARARDATQHKNEKRKARFLTDAEKMITTVHFPWDN